MIGKATRAKLIAQLKATGTLAESVPANVISEEDTKLPHAVAIASVLRRHRAADSGRWLPSSAHLVLLP